MCNFNKIPLNVLQGYKSDANRRTSGSGLDGLDVLSVSERSSPRPTSVSGVIQINKCRGSVLRQWGYGIRVIKRKVSETLLRGHIAREFFQGDLNQLND